MADMLSSILDVNAISLDIKAKKKPDIIRELVEILGASGAVRNVDSVTSEVIAREELATTAVDKQPVQLFFLMVGLPGSHNEHLRLLSKLSRYLYDPDTKASLLAAPTPEEVVAIFAGREGA